MINKTLFSSTHTPQLTSPSQRISMFFQRAIQYKAEISQKITTTVTKCQQLISSRAGKILSPFTFQRKFPEPLRQSFAYALKDFNIGRLCFIRNVCMKSSTEFDPTKTIHLQGENRSFIAKGRYIRDITVKMARQYGFLFTPEQEEIIAQHPDIKVRPFVIHCSGISSGDTFNQLVEGAKNMLGFQSSELKTACDRVADLVKHEQDKHKDDPSCIVVPYITGFSLGGLFAHVIALTHHYGSCVINCLGVGPSACELIGKKNWDLACSTHCDQHITFCTEYDFTTSKFLPFAQTTQIPGTVYSIAHGQTDGAFKPVSMHTEYRQIFTQFIEQKQEEALRRLSL